MIRGERGERGGAVVLRGREDGGERRCGEERGGVLLPKRKEKKRKRILEKE